MGRGIKAKSHKTSGALNKGYMYVNIPVEMEQLCSNLLFETKKKLKQAQQIHNYTSHMP
jgi:hypothetical protein